MPGALVPNEDDQLMSVPPPPRGWWHIARLVGVLLTFLLVLAIIWGGVSLLHGVGPNFWAARSDCPACYAYPRMMSISMVSAHDGWAVGIASSSQGVIAHDQNGRWVPFNLPASTPALHSVAMLSASDGWSVGYGGTILHYTGRRWLSVASPTQANLTSVFLLSATDGWAVGWGTILHYNGAMWDIVTTIPPSNPLWELESVFMVSPSEGWAVSAEGGIAHYYQGAWTPQNLAGLPSYLHLVSVTMSSASEGWAVGVGPQGTTLILHYQNGQWHVDDSAEKVVGTLSAVVMVSPDEGWALGTAGNTASSFFSTIRESGVGSWWTPAWTSR